MDKKPRVLNKHRDAIPPDAIYVGRPSKWGNPFRLPKFYRSQTDDVKVAMRASVIRLYEEYLEEHPEIIKVIRDELRGKDLVCHCAPLPCHADILLKVANEG